MAERQAPAALDALGRLAQSDPAVHVRIAAVKALARFGGERYAPMLIALCRDEEQDLAEAALIALGRIDLPQAEAVLREALHAGDEQHRLTAVRALQESRGRDRVYTLQWIAAADESLAVAQAAIAALAVIGTAEAVAALIGLAAEAERRDFVVDALSRLADDALQALEQGLGHGQESARLAVVEALARVRRPAATELLVGALENPSAAVRAEAARALGGLGTRRAESRLADLAQNDPSTQVRRAAFAALERSPAGLS